MSRNPRLAFAGLVATAVLTIAACGTSTSSGGVAGATGSPATSGSPSASASAEASASPSGSAPLKQAFLQFKEANGSGITGGAILTDLGNSQTAVTIGVVAAGVTDPMPSSLVPGECTTLATGGGPSASAGASAAASAAPSAPASAAASGSPEPSGSAVPLTPGSLIKLGDLSAGSSNTVVNIGLDGLTSQPYAVVIYKSAKDQSVVACADVKM